MGRKDYVRCSRLILEAGSNAVTVRFHPRLTIVAGVARIERESLAGELLGALGGGRDGAHLELVDDAGKRFAVVRSRAGVEDRVVELGARLDVTDDFRAPNGDLDLLARAGLDREQARRVLRLRASDLSAASDGDRIIARLAGLEPERLWRAAERLRDAEAWLADEAATRGATPEDAEVLEAIERHHAEFERATARHDSVRHHGIFIAGACALGAVPAALLTRFAAIPFLAIALATWMLSILFRRRMERAAVAEQEALARAGAQSYLGFHLQRVNGRVDASEQNGRLAEAADELRRAREGWAEIAGGIDVAWVEDQRVAIEAARRGDAVGPAPAVPGGGDIVHALEDWLAARSDDPFRLPLVLDEPLSGHPAVAVTDALDRLLAAPTQLQLIYLTEDPVVAAWGRERAASGELGVLEPAPEQEEAPAKDRLVEEPLAQLG